MNACDNNPFFYESECVLHYCGKYISLDAVTESFTEMQKLFNCNVYSGFFSRDVVLEGGEGEGGIQNVGGEISPPKGPEKNTVCTLMHEDHSFNYSYPSVWPMKLIRV